MKTAGVSILIVVLASLITGCTKMSGDSYKEASDLAVSIPGSGNPNQAGVITAGEWNDLKNWNFWDSIIKKDPFNTYEDYWKLYMNNRVSVKVLSDEGKASVDVPVQLLKNGKVVYTARTNNKGLAELWAGLYQKTTVSNWNEYQINVNNGTAIINSVIPISQGINQVNGVQNTNSYNVDIAFVVDATGSMGDELEFLKTELLDVLERVQSDNPDKNIRTSSVFYRDEGDEYVTREFDFTANHLQTIDFISQQSANGGGDFPEAVHAALDKSVNMQWSANAKSRILFLILDAPPHHKSSVITNLQTSIAKAAEKGIKIIPVTASGIDKETEFLMRFFALTTNGSYVFITNHSGIGNDHLEATVGEYEVEFLNNLMVRVVNESIK